MRIQCRAVLLDAGGVVVLPDRRLVTQALARASIGIDPGSVPAAHYRAVRALDREPRSRAAPDAYLHALSAALRIEPERRPAALQALALLADRSASGTIMWSEPALGALSSITSLRRAGIAVLVVTNSDGHAAENLRDAGICWIEDGAATGSDPGVPVDGVIDSAIVGCAKPEPGIFHAALRSVRVPAGEAVHVGDMISADVDGAHAAGIVPIHLDPRRACRRRDHRHVRSLAGIWRHIAAAPGANRR